MTSQRKFIQAGKIGVKGKDNSIFSSAERNNFFISRLLQSHIASLNNIITRFTQEVYAAGEEAMVGKKFI